MASTSSFHPIATQLVVLCFSCLVSCSNISYYQDSSPFPSGLQVGFFGRSTLGAEPSLISSPIQPSLQNHYPLLDPTRYDNNTQFNPIRSWGNLSPLTSLPHDTFGIQSSPALPHNYTLEQVHLLHRHGARFPPTDETFTQFADIIKTAQSASSFKANGQLSFLRNWNYQLGTELLTPFGRSEMFQLGVAYRQKYGLLLSRLNQTRPVFRTTSQDRMYHSALNFAAGFFGIPAEEKYHQSILIESKGFNNSLAAYYACPKSDSKEFSEAGNRAVEAWRSIYLKEAHNRIIRSVTGVDFALKNIYTMQQLCAYETVALGKSPFCSLFTEEEWKGYAYASDLEFWYSNSFGNPLSPALGLGWTEELLARLSRTPLTQGSSSINITLDADPVTFPLEQPIYVDATHDVIISAVITTLNITSLTNSGPLPTSHMIEPRAFRVEQLTPFGAHLSAQVVSHSSTKYIRFILNDAILPLDGLKPCEKNLENGFCKLSSFIQGLKDRIKEIDYQKLCF